MNCIKESLRLRRGLNRGLLLSLLLAVTGCQPADPLERKVSAETSLSLTLWRSRMAAKFPEQSWRDFDEVLQEIRYSVMRAGASGSSEVVDQALRERIAGRSLREVLMLGWREKLGRLRAENDELERIIEGNAGLRTRVGDVESAGYLEHRRTEQLARRARLREEIRETESKLRMLTAP